MRSLVRGDIDGFFGLALDNLVQLILINSLCRYVLDFPAELIYGRILPGVAVSLLFGNLFYAWQARRLARAEGRTDVCALPYGINTASLFAYVFLVMLPAKLLAEAAGAEDPSRVAWQAGLVACMGSGLIEFLGSFVADRLRRFTPRAALLSTLAGIAISFITLSFFLRAYARPVVGLATLGIVLLTYFGGVKFRWGLPGGLVAVAVGVALAFATGIAPVGEAPSGGLGFFPPKSAWPDLLEGLSSGVLIAYLGVILPMGLFNLLGSLQNIESAEAGGDTFPAAPSLAMNGVGSMAAALFGSCFPTTIYIGHPGWKAMGARSAYSVLNGAFFTAICLTGLMAHVVYAVPVDAGMAIVLWIGIVITAQAFSATPRSHAPAVVIGLLPGIAAWATMLIKTSLRVAGYGSQSGPPFSDQMIVAFQKSDVWLAGAFAIDSGFIFTSMILAALTVCIIERRFRQAGGWALVAALISCTGLMHGYVLTRSDAVLHLSLQAPWNNSWATGYLILAAVLFGARWLTVPVMSGED